ncbi:MAG: transposase [Acholeplasmatales bacterium]|nr:transposase [Acholeplasmatales bacterium]
MRFKTLKYHYKANSNEIAMLKLLCRISKNLYNATLYYLRQYYFEHNTIPSYFDTNKILKDNENFHTINTYQSICTIRCAHNNMMKFIKKHGSLPKYLPKNGFYPLYTDQVRPIVYKGHNCIKLPLSNDMRTNKVFNNEYEDELIKNFINDYSNKESINIFFKIPKLLDNKEIHQVRIVPDKKGEYYTIEFSYKDEEYELKPIDDKVMGIDLGVTNLASCVMYNNESFVIDGKSLLSKIQFTSKRLAKLQSNLPNGIYTSKRIESLRRKNNNYINDYLNKSVKELLNKAKDNNISQIIVGWNKGIKTGGIKNESLKGKKRAKTNQNFISLPISKFKNKLILKALEYGINIIEINESYTSASSFYDNDEIKKDKPRSGKRIKRGLYKRKDGTLINADINAALNMIKKYKRNSNDTVIKYLMSRGLTIPYRVYVNM